MDERLFPCTPTETERAQRRRLHATLQGALELDVVEVDDDPRTCPACGSVAADHRCEHVAGELDLGAATCSLSFCSDPYHATYEDDGPPIDLCLEHFDDVAR